MLAFFILLTLCQTREVAPEERLAVGRTPVQQRGRPAPSQPTTGRLQRREMKETDFMPIYRPKVRMYIYDIYIKNEWVYMYQCEQERRIQGVRYIVCVPLLNLFSCKNAEVSP